MEPLDLSDLPQGALVLLDSAPIIYFLEGHPKFAQRFQALFDEHAVGKLRFAVTTITIAEVLTDALVTHDRDFARVPALRVIA